MPDKTKASPASPGREKENEYDAAVSDRLMGAAHRKAVPEFLTEEALAEGVMTQFGVLLTQVSVPRYAKLSAKYFHLARLSETRPSLKEYEPIIRLGARTCAVLTALVGTPEEQDRLRRQIADDPAERDSLTRHMLRMAAMTPDERDQAITSATRREIWARPSSDCLERSMIRARLVHALLESGHEADAKRDALELGRDVIGAMLHCERSEEGLFQRNRLAAVMRSLRDAGALEGTNIITLVEAALDADTALVRAVGPDLTPPRNLH
jgi:hypothetical protein